MQRNTLLAIAISLIVGCGAKTAPVNFSMMSAQGVDADVDFAVNSVEVKHAEDGWIMIEMPAEAGKIGAMEAGTAITLASSELPKGSYTMVRVKYAATMTDPMAMKAFEKAKADAEKTMTRAAEAAEGEEGAEGAENAMEEKAAMEGEGAEGEEKTMTRAGEEKVMTPPEPVREDHVAKLEQAFCIEADGALQIEVTRGEGELALSVNAPGC